ncbi:hypothetical protein OSTOST_09764, partial [Ostertagia ostertagi]
MSPTGYDRAGGVTCLSISTFPSVDTENGLIQSCDLTITSIVPEAFLDFHNNQAMVGRSHRSGASNVRGFWQASVEDEERARRETIRHASSKPYSFPRWRSSDALSASLVASNSVDVPKDSRIPEQRLQKMKETDRLAEIHKAHIHEQVGPPQSLRKGKSLDSLVLQVDHQPWYDRNKIRDSVCRESIGNIAEARERFESHEFSRLNK